MVPNKLLILPFLFSSLATAFAQNIEKKLMLVMPDSVIDKHGHIHFGFGPGEDYCYYTGSVGDSFIAEANGHKYGPFTKVESKFQASILYNELGKEQYFTNASGDALYGPIDGKIDFGSTNYNCGLAYTVSAGDSVVYYINGKRIAATDSTVVIDSWCAFSDNGNLLYTIRLGKWSYLYWNHKLTDSSTYYYDRLNIDDQNNYCYALGTFDKKDDCRCCQFKPIAHHEKKVISPLMLSGYSLLYGYGSIPRYDSILYYRNGNGTTYPASENYCKFPDKSRLKMITSGNSILLYNTNMFPYKIQDYPSPSTQLCINGKMLQLPYATISLPCIDSFGHYALFGRRGYYMYKNVDGVEEKMPLSKHGARATPVSIDERGNTICYYDSGDSVYVYQNDHLFKSCAVEQFDFRPGNSRIDGSWQEGLPILCMDSCSYIVYKNTISPPLLRISKNQRNDALKAGDVVYGKMGEHGCWSLQKIGERQYDLLVNNRRVVLPPGINLEGAFYEHLVSEFRLTDKEFIFYAQNGNRIYRYKITL